MSNIKFDVDGARAAGYTDAQIAEKLAEKANFDVQGARAAGFKDDQIIGRLVQPVTKAATPQSEVEDPGMLGATLIGAGRTFDRIGKGMKQLYYGATNNTEAQAKLKAEAADDDVIYDRLKTVRPVATLIGEAAPSMILPAGGAATTLGAMTKLAASGAVPAALEYGSASERAGRAATAGAGAVVGGAVIPKAVGMAASGVKSSLKGLAGNVTPEALALAGRAEQLGISVNAAQLGDSKFLKTLASAIEQMPFTGGAKINAKQQSDFTRAVSKTFGDDVEKITPEVYAANKARLKTTFDDLAMRNTLNVDDALMTRLETILSEARQMADDGTTKAVDNVINRLIKQSNASTNEVPNVAMAGVPRHTTTIEVPGAAYSSIDSMLSKAIKSGGEKGNYLGEVQKAIRLAMDDSIAPADQEAWKLARNQYKNLKAVRDIVARDAGDGNVPPMQLLNALNNSEAGKEAMAMGTRGTLGELGRIGRQFVRDPVPNSGTAQRALAMGLIGGGGYAFGADPLTIAGMLAGGATAGRTLSKVMNNPKVVQSLAKQGISMKDLAKMPPSRIAQIIGGTAGMATAESIGD
ncbi:hypothetical protein UFOVP580_16 [uncultured Caudovirales phage]|uniref:Uncharacterized protein n=1 Tax=uncultured Caudovirales phage TaxID=2100421 RepID=A0A6J5PB42_9CAUD|nr:hypothetical protein UFOVP580_16 [uncultured Caudovirales phage]